VPFINGVFSERVLPMKSENYMWSGKVIFFNRKKGWGLVQQDGDPTDAGVLFFHHTDILPSYKGEFECYRTFDAGQEVKFSSVSGGGATFKHKFKRIGGVTKNVKQAV
jgi:cold shock CspA family protein